MVQAVLWLAGALFLLAVGTLLLFAIYPLALAVLSLTRRVREPKPQERLPSVSLLTVVRNAGGLIEGKIRNSLAVDYPEDKMEIIFYSDGSTDQTERILRSYESERFRVFRSTDHEGKIRGLNRAMEHCSGEIVVFSDGDALLERDAVRKLVRHYRDPVIGGVGGRQVIGEDLAGLDRNAQSVYLHFDGLVKLMESRIGTVTSNHGKLYSIRRELFRPVPDGVADDLYVALLVVRGHHRFTYEREARAHVRVPSRSPSHEVRRRRRIVSQSLRGIYLMRALLNPFRYGTFAVGLAVNKVLRRLLPFSLLALLLSSLLLTHEYPWAWSLVLAQVAFWAFSCSHRAIGRWRPNGILQRWSEVAFYIAVGQYGTMLGVIDFLFGRSVTKWDPVKTDEDARIHL